MKKEITVLKTALTEAGKIALKHAGKVGFKLKGRNDLITKADKEAQRKAVQIIAAAFPAHGFLVEEEQAGIKTKGRYIWVIDPIDGTTNYAHTFAHSAVSIALTDNGVPVLGGVYDFFKGEMFLAQKGRGAKLNGRAIKVSSARRLEDALLVTGFPYDRSNIRALYLPLFEDFLKRCHDIRRTGSAALDLCWLACGRLDGYWELNLNPWDVCAGKLILEEAGGIVSDFYGKPWADLKTFGRQTIASNGKIHKEMLAVLKKYKAVF